MHNNTLFHLHLWIITKIMKLNKLVAMRKGNNNSYLALWRIEIGMNALRTSLMLPSKAEHMSGLCEDTANALEYVQQEIGPR